MKQCRPLLHRITSTFFSTVVLYRWPLPTVILLILAGAINLLSQSLQHSLTMLPPYIWAIAGLALTAAVHASPLPADNSTTAVDEAPTFYMPGEPVIVSTKVTTDSVPKVTTDAPNDSPTEPPIDEPIEHIPIGPPTNVTTSATAESSGPQVSGFYSNTTTLNKTTANLPEATKICKHDARDPKTWKDSGAARYVEDFLDDNKFSTNTPAIASHQKADIDLQASGF